MSAWGGILFVRSRHCGELNRGLQNLDSLFGKVLILLVGRCYLGGLIRGLQNLEAPCKGTFFGTFCGVQKVPQKHARTCKKLPVASFCASETAETGRIANGREQGDHVSRRQGGKGFNFVSAKLWFCALIRGSQNLEAFP